MKTEILNDDVMHALESIWKTRDDLTCRFINRQDEIQLAVTALISNSNFLMFGDPGTAKSQLSEAFASAFGFNRSASSPDDRYFRTQLTKFSTPEDLFGPVSIKGIKSDVFRRVTDRTLADCGFAFVDEIFKANEAILNSLLGVLEERIYINGPDVMSLPLTMVIAASNELPKPGGPLRAVYDRFTLRKHVLPLTSESDLVALAKMKLKHSTNPTTIHTTTMDEVNTVRAVLDDVVVPDDVIHSVITARKQIQNNHDIAVSDRAFCNAFDLIKATALLKGNSVATTADVTMLADSWWKIPEDRGPIATELMKVVSTDLVEGMELFDAAVELFNTIDLKNPTDNIGDISKANRGMREIKERLSKLDDTLPDIQKWVRLVEDMQNEIGAVVYSAIYGE